MRFSSPGLVSFMVKPLGLYTVYVSTATHTLLNPDSISTSIHSSILVFGFLQAQFPELGHCKQDSDWHF